MGVLDKIARPLELMVRHAAEQNTELVSHSAKPILITPVALDRHTQSVVELD